MYGSPCDKADITSPKADKDVLIDLASFNASFSLITPDFFTLSDPAKSTKFNFPMHFWFVDLFYDSINIVNIICDLEELEFNLCDVICLKDSPSS